MADNDFRYCMYPEFFFIVVQLQLSAFSPYPSTLPYIFYSFKDALESLWYEVQSKWETFLFFFYCP